MTVRIYKPAKNAMQSGTRKTSKWVLEYSPEQHKHLDPLMGWTGSGDMHGQVRLKFDSREHAIAYAEKNGLDYEVIEPHVRKPRIKSYADAFAFKG
ncbi:ETC complex I subunit [Emcibacter nanhaiensis]|uniref:ETC complex I subunit n=1 Tax=Emcibacter nanhaiensis TaxID=1505037 RepID=A0A501PRC2_9PROT|nr:ETC complex I subunit [Emcibacter nanhaiensis]TPD62667.1 ETC complex I subunit [Emcibacter nanhaiensis]